MIEDKDNQDSVDNIIQNLFQEEPIRRRCLDFLADSIVSVVLPPRSFFVKGEFFINFW